MSSHPTVRTAHAPTPPEGGHRAADQPAAEIPAKALRWLRAAGQGFQHALRVVHVGRRSFDSALFGVVLTVLAIAVDAAGWLASAEYLLYDARAKLFQFYLPAPSDQLVHLDVDEGVLEAIRATEKERFPWPRSILAEMMDEVAVAGPRVVGLDILFPEPQKPSLVPIPGATTRPAAGGDDDVYDGPARLVRHDDLLAASFRRLGCVLVPVSLPFKRQHPPSDLQAALRAELAADLNATRPALVERLRTRGFAAKAGAAGAAAGATAGATEAGMPAGTPAEAAKAGDLAGHVDREYLAAWRFEMSAAIRRELHANPAAGPDQVWRKLMRTGHAERVTFDDLYREALSATHVARFSRPVPPGAPALFATTLENLPVPPLAAAAAYSGYVDHPPFPDGRVRALPLFVAHGDRMYPQMGLAMACAQLGVDVGSLRLGPDSLVIPVPGGREVVVPYRSIRSAELGREIATFMDVPWWGGTDWTTMYDPPATAGRPPTCRPSRYGTWCSRGARAGGQRAGDGRGPDLGARRRRRSRRRRRRRPAPAAGGRRRPAGGLRAVAAGGGGQCGVRARLRRHGPRRAQPPVPGRPREPGRPDGRDRRPRAKPP